MSSASPDLLGKQTIQVTAEAATKNGRISVDSFSCVSRQLWLYCLPLLRRGWKNQLDDNSGLGLPAKLTMQVCAPRADSNWAKEAEKLRSQGKGSFTNAFSHLVRCEFVKGCMIGASNGLLNTLVRPFILRECIQSLSPTEDGVDTTRSLVLWGSLILVSLLEAWTAVAVMCVCCDEVFTQFVVAASRLMCRKSLCIAPCDDAHQISSLFGNDVVRTYEAARALGFLPLSLTAVAGGIAMLFYTVGVAALGGLVSILLLFWMTQKMAKAAGHYTKLHLETSTQRLAVLEQIVDSSKAVKLFSWEESYLQRLDSCRDAELTHVKKLRWYLILSIQLGRVSPILSSAVTVVFMVLLDMDLRASDIFAVIAVFMAMRLALIVLPQGLTSAKMILVSFNRIQAYLEKPDSTPRSTLPVDSQHAVEVADVDLAWPGTAVTVVRGALRVERGQALAVVGPVGCGKSALLSAVVGELVPARGAVRSAAGLRYAPQRPQVICGTVLDNILLGRAYDEASLQQAIRASALVRDLERLPGGLAAEIGERGVSLSGGQKQRVSLARAAYSLTKDDILVLDDPIAAVDPAVGKQIMEQLVVAHRARGGTVVVALNQAAYLHLFDRIITVEDAQLRELPRHAEKQPEGPAPVEEAAEEQLPHQANVDGKVVHQEIKKQGAIDNQVVVVFFRSMGTACLGSYLLAGVLGYGCMASADVWLANWTKAQGFEQSEHLERLGVYLGLVCAFATFILACSRIGVIASTRASLLLHRQTIERLMRAPLSWWDGTPRGRITSRFSTDLGVVDTQLGFMVDNSLQLFLNILALCGIVMLVVPLLSILIVLCFLLFACFFLVVDRTMSSMKRMSHQAMAPLLSNISECVQMQHTAKLLAAEMFFISRNDDNTDAFNRMNFGGGILMQFMRFCVSSCAALIAAGTTAWLMFFSVQDPQLGAVAMTYSITIPYFMSMGCQTLGIVKMMFTALERLLEYRELPQEPPWHLPGDPEAWPTLGQLAFEDVHLRYQPHLPLALRGVSFSVPGSARVGIVGRTGSGKSTLVACLFRLHQMEAGRVVLDGVDINQVGLRCLRRCITVVPQDPVLMVGTIRENLDPFGKVPEQDLSKALFRAALASSEADAATVLARNLEQGGSNLSCGERQLLCLARAVISGPKVLVLDEPTSSTDPDTDTKVQSMIRTCFACTTLCVAHRIQTVMDSDLLLVMGDGQVQEFGGPAELARIEGGEFRRMCKLCNLDMDTLQQHPEAKLELLSTPQVSKTACEERVEKQGQCLPCDTKVSI
eukprot:TRINITY_DN24331_c0_g1_i1.p1 TRINITY_DN24331_c0_g1~~TRINITY_DN24331_c0_g1_i1.p1  ORF type:complete len:1280 (+),score=245.70 TRINITY_DN24331_c0_g1_i1:53-3892(+)